MGQVKYTPDYAEQMLEFFREDPKNDNKASFKNFADKIGVSYSTIMRWGREYPEFKKAYQECLEMQSVYRPEYSQMMIDYFYSAELTKEIVTEEKVLKDGTKVQKKAVVGCECPTFEIFARRIGVSTRTLLNWKDDGERYPEFKEAYAKCKDAQNNILIQNGLSGRFNPIFMRLAAVNMMKWRDAKEVTNRRDYSKVDDKDLQDRIASKKAKIAKSSQIVNNIMDNIRTQE